MQPHHGYHQHHHHHHHYAQSLVVGGAPPPTAAYGGGYGSPYPSSPAPSHHHHHHHHGHSHHHHSSHHHHHHHEPRHHHSHHHHHSQAPLAAYGGGYGGGGGSVSHNVKVHVENCSYPINREVLEQIFTRVAHPVKIDCGPSGQVTLATVGFADAHSAQRAVSELNHKQIYPNCCRMTLTLEAPPQASRYPPSAGPYGHPAHHHHHHSHGHHHHSLHHHHHHSLHHHHQHHTPGFRGRGRGGAYGAPPVMSSPYGAPPVGAPTGESAVVIVSGVPETTSLHSLWVLLEVYGNVNSLKRQYSQKENVVAQFQNLYDARGVVGLLHGCPYYGSLLGLKHFAGYVERSSGKTEWNAGPAEDPATQAVLFTSGYHHRTKPSAPYNATQKAKPDSYLFIANLTDTISDDDLRHYFHSKGFELTSLYRKSPVAAIVALESPARAVEALIATHATMLQERYLRVSFSRYPPGPPPSGAVFEEPQ